MSTAGRTIVYRGGDSLCLNLDVNQEVVPRGAAVLVRSLGIARKP